MKLKEGDWVQRESQEAYGVPGFGWKKNSFGRVTKIFKKPTGLRSSIKVLLFCDCMRPHSEGQHLPGNNFEPGWYVNEFHLLTPEKVEKLKQLHPFKTTE